MIDQPDQYEMIAVLKTYGLVRITQNSFGNWQVTLVNNKGDVVTWDANQTVVESVRAVYNRLQQELAAAGVMIIG